MAAVEPFVGTFAAAPLVAVAAANTWAGLVGQPHKADCIGRPLLAVALAWPNEELVPFAEVAADTLDT